MNREKHELLINLAKQYHVATFISNDPVSVPHRYSKRADIEISGLLIAVMSFGNRKQILRKGEVLCDRMGESPLAYIGSGKWQSDFSIDNTDSFYRTLSYRYFHHLFRRLAAVYATYDSLEDALLVYGLPPMQALCRFLEVSDKSPQKKLNMYLRWMIRRNSPVDFGLWSRFNQSDLIIPLDTHVLRMAYLLGLTDRQTPSLTNAHRITERLKEIFPEDPCLGDFALFGYGVEHRKTNLL